MKQLYLIFFLCYGIASAQSLEEAIYSATENFNTAPTTAALLQLEKVESTFKDRLISKDDQLAYVFLLCNKAYYLKNFDLNKAITNYEKAWQRFTNHKLSKFSNYDMIENCLKPLGNLYIKTRAYTNAESTIKQYLFLAEQQQNKTHKIAGSINLAILNYSKGDHTSVLRITDLALKDSDLTTEQKHNLSRIRNRSLIALGATLPNSKRTEQLSNYLNYELELSRGNYKKALAHFQKAKEQLYQNSSLREASKLLLQEAQLHYKLEQPNQAAKNLYEALKKLLPNYQGHSLPPKELLYSENTFIDIFELLAEFQELPEKKLQCYDLSFYVSGLLSTKTSTQETKLLNLTNNRILSEKCIAICYASYTNSKDLKFLVDAFYYAEQHKATILKEKQLTKTLFQQFPKDSILQKEQELLQKQEQLTSRLVHLPLEHSQNNPITNTLFKELSTVNFRLKQIKESILEKYPNAKNNHFTISELQQKLALDKAIMVEYFYGKSDLYQFIISNAQLSFFKIPLNASNRRSINTFIGQFDHASKINNDISGFTENAFETYNILNLPEARSHKNILIIPDGLLNFIPFEALLTHRTTSKIYSKMPFLITSYHIAYNSSVQFYQRQRPLLKSNALLGVFPVFENSDQALSHSIKEAEAIAALMDARLFMNEEASVSNVIENASTYNILHLSTHATSGSFTQSARIEFYDKSMPIDDLYGFNLNTELVVLSACETGVGRLQKGEGALSIARGFQYAGAKRLVFSLWRINDLSTSQIMHSFYKNYSSTNSGVSSNHKSKISYLNNENISNIKKSPYYWSAFVYYGDFSENPPAVFSFISLSILLLIALIVLLLVYKIKPDGKISKA